jgi:hypothetical protein
VSTTLSSPPGTDPFGGPPPRGSRGARSAFLGSIALLLVAIVAMVVLGRGDTSRSPDGMAVVVDDGAPPVEVAVAAPDDGADSLGLPVRAEPADGLLDGQQISVFAEEFPPFAEVALVQCSPHAGESRGVERCMISTFERAVADHQGSVFASFTVQRLLVIGDREIDCAGPPPDGHTASCSVAVGMLSDYDVSGTAPLHFDPDAELAAHPTVLISNQVDLADYELVTLTIRNPGVGSRWHVNQCVVRANPAHCGGGAVVDPVDPELQGAVFSPDGSDIVATVPLRRMIDDVDCAREPEACSLVLQRQEDMRIYSTRLTFQPGAPLAPATIVIDPPSPVAAGSEVGLEVVNRAPGQLTHPVLQCPAGSAAIDLCVPVGSPHLLVAAGGRGTITPVTRIDAGGSSTDCSVEGACVLRVVDPGGSVAAEVPVVVIAG